MLKADEMRPNCERVFFGVDANGASTTIASHASLASFFLTTIILVLQHWPPNGDGSLPGDGAVESASSDPCAVP